MAMDGHECNAYCRPAEGEHCEVRHVWSSRPNDTIEETAEIDTLLVECGELFDYALHGTVVRITVAREVPPQDELGRAREMSRRGVSGLDILAEQTWFPYYVGAYLSWSKVPSEVPA